MEFKNLGSGDSGKSRIGKKMISKTSPEIEALGSLDELNSLLGLIKTQKMPKEFKSILGTIQKNLFLVQTNIAGLLYCGKESGLKNIKIDEINNLIDLLSKQVGEIKSFVIVGENEPTAWLDYARAVARRVERRVLVVSVKGRSASGGKKLDKISTVYLNRLSSLLFVMARVCAEHK